MSALIYVVGALALVSAAGVVLSRQTIYSALSLVGNMVSLAVLFLLLNAQFLAAVQVIVYAGAVMVLFVFIVALLSPGAEEGRRLRDPRLAVGAAAILYVTIQIFALADNGTTYDKRAPRATCQTLTQALNAQRTGDCSPAPLRGEQSAINGGTASGDRNTLRPFLFYPNDVNRKGNVQTVGGELFTTFLLPFEVTSLLLLVAAIGAVYLSRGEVAERRGRSGRGAARR